MSEGKAKSPSKAKKTSVIVLDVGSSFIKAGWAGEDTPRCSVPAVVLKNPKASGSFGRPADANAPPFLVGKAALAALNELHKSRQPTSGKALVRPVVRGRVVDWDAMCQILRYIFVEVLKVGAQPQFNVLVVEPPVSDKSSRTEFANKLFSEFRIPALGIVNRGTMAVFEAGEVTGIALVTDRDFSMAVPVYEGVALTHAVLKTRVSGGSLAEAMRIAMMQLGAKSLQDESWTPVIEDIVDKSCFLVDLERRDALLGGAAQLSNSLEARVEEQRTRMNPTKLKKKIMADLAKNVTDAERDQSRQKSLTALARALSKAGVGAQPGVDRKGLAAEKKAQGVPDQMLYELPVGKDGRAIPVPDAVRVVVPEILFSPRATLGALCDEFGLQDLLFCSIRMCDQFVMNQLFGNIVLVGELTNMKGFPERIKAEMRTLCNSFQVEAQPKVAAEPRREDASWRGASMFATLSTFKECQFTKGDLADENIVVAKYF